MAASFFCSARFFLLLLLLSAVPIGILISLESSQPTTHYYHYYGTGWLRECTKWDDVNRRFLTSFMDGGADIGEIPVPGDHNSSATVLQEIQLVRDTDLAGNGSFGFVIDQPRNRVVVANADVFGNAYSALAAYDLNSWNRLFLTHLSVSDDGKTFADDVAVDAEGNAYVTDAQGSKIWKVGVNGEFQSVITSPLFHAKEWDKELISRNGIAYHPNGYLLVAHTITGHLFKIEVKTDHLIRLVKVDLGFSEGIEL